MVINGLKREDWSLLFKWGREMNFIKLAKWTTPKSLKKLFSVNCLSGIGEPEAELELQAQNQTETHTHPKPITRNQDRNGAPSTCP